MLVSRGVVLLLSPMRFAVLLLAPSNRQRIFKSMISALQERAQSAVTVMEQSGRQAHTSVAHAEEAATALDGIGQRVNEITDMNAQIATAVEQQGAVK